MKKIYLSAYLNKNLGDDIFVDMLSKRYPNQKFYCFETNNLKYNYKNVTIYNGIIYRGINKVMKLLSNRRISINKILAKRSKVGVLIGGSMFIENKSGFKDEMLLIDKNFILGSNFGPFKDENYPKKFYQLFKKSEVVSFRDCYSYNLFKDLGNNIQYAPDIVFGLETEKYMVKDSKKVIFSIIDCKSKISAEYEEKYDNTIIELTNYFCKLGYEIIYMSFCKNEGDENAINRILEKTPLRNEITTYFYENNIEEAINIIADSQVIVGSRFHANILGLVFNKTIIPLIYSDKTKNFLEDIDFKGIKIDIRKLEEFNINAITEEKINYKLDVSNYKEKSVKHFEKLDKILK